MNPQILVECRPPKWVWIGIALIVVFPLWLCLSGPVKDAFDLKFRWFSLFFFPLYRVYLCWQARRTFIRADEIGLSWRGQMNSGSVEWAEIEDFGFRQNGNSPIPFVKFVGGELRPQGFLTHLPELQKVIAERAVNSASREWKLRQKTVRLGGFKRENEETETFDYGDFRWESAFWALVFLGLSVSVFSRSGPQILRDAATIGWFLALAAPLAGLIMLSLPLLMWRSAAIKNREAARFRGQQFVVENEGFTFKNGDASRFVPWSDVLVINTALENSPFGWEAKIETQNGEIHFLSAGLRRRERFFELLRHFAPDAVWKSEISQKMMRELRFRRSIDADARVQTHSYRNRAGLLNWFGSAFFAFMFAVPFWNIVVAPWPQFDGDSLFFGALFLLSLVLPFWGLWGLLFVQIRADENGIERRVLGRKTRVEWNGAMLKRRQWLNGWTTYEVRNGDVCVGFNFGLSDVSEFVSWIKTKVARFEDE